MTAIRFSGKYALQYALLCAFGGVVYGGLEIAWRGYTHLSMVLLGGLCFAAIGALKQLNQKHRWNMALTSLMLIFTLTAALGELVTGLLVNIWLGQNVWDYSNLPYNLGGQICMGFCCLWLLLSLPAILLDDLLRRCWFGEKWHRYKLF